ncbi:MAG: Uma2 family endonuclease [Limnothrix sp. RL_2_0]|nr:Uma2 family endonuclease [Limnothrix sp. RL_2_0]
MMTFTLDFSSILNIDDEQFEKICHNNPDIQFERTAQGELIIMPPVGAESGNREMDLMGALWLWNSKTKLGKVFSSSTCFKLPNGALKSPDAAWIELSRWNKLSAEAKKKFAPICPDFVVELRSESDSIKTLQAKMQEYIDNGTKLGWLIDPQAKEVTIYKLDQTPEILTQPSSLDGGNLLPDFTCNLDFLWD